MRRKIDTGFNNEKFSGFPASDQKKTPERKAFSIFPAPRQKKKVFIVTYDLDGTLIPENITKYQEEQFGVQTFTKTVAITSRKLIENFSAYMMQKIVEKANMAEISDTVKKTIQEKIAGALNENKDEAILYNIENSQKVFDAVRPFFKNVFETRVAIRAECLRTARELLISAGEKRSGAKTPAGEFHTDHIGLIESGLMFAGAQKLLRDTKTALQQIAAPGTGVYLAIISNASPIHIEPAIKNSDFQQSLMCDGQSVDKPGADVTSKDLEKLAVGRIKGVMKPSIEMFKRLIKKTGVNQEDVVGLIHIGNDKISDGKFLTNVKDTLIAQPSADPDLKDFIHFISFEPQTEPSVNFGKPVITPLQTVIK